MALPRLHCQQPGFLHPLPAVLPAHLDPFQAAVGIPRAVPADWSLLLGRGSGPADAGRARASQVQDVHLKVPCPAVHSMRGLHGAVAPGAAEDQPCPAQRSVLIPVGSPQGDGRRASRPSCPSKAGLRNLRIARRPLFLAAAHGSAQRRGCERGNGARVKALPPAISPWRATAPAIATRWSA
jgi:hypothetical protein